MKKLISVPGFKKVEIVFIKDEKKVKYNIIYIILKPTR